MQVLSFVNAAGPEAWKNRDSKRFVRSHAMKDFRRKQRERKKLNSGDHQFGTLSESSFDGTALLSQGSDLPDQDVAQVHAADEAVGPCKIPSPTGSLKNNCSRNRTTSSPTSDPSLYKLFDGTASTTRPCGQLPQIFPLQDVLSSASSLRLADSRQYSLLKSSKALVNRSYDFDLSVCMAVYACLDAASANYEQFAGHYFRSVHSYLTIVHRKGYLDRVQALAKKANAEVALLLLCMYICSEPTRSSTAAAASTTYLTAKSLFKTVSAAKPVSIELVQAGALLVLFEHNAGLYGSDRETFRDCHCMAKALELDASVKNEHTVDDEERRRAYWGLLSLDCMLSLHDEKHEYPLLFPVPSPTDVLPSISDSDYEEASVTMPSSNAGFLVQSRLPRWTDGFSRQGQAIRLLYMVLMLIRERFDSSPDLMISRIEHLDSLIVSTLGNLLADCDGKATQYCCPIACCLSASYLLHEYQLLATMHSPSKKAADIQAPTRSKLAIETMIDMLVNILREFPLSHTPELSPLAIWCPYKAAMLGLLLDQINGLNRQPTIAGTTFELMVNGLRHFSTVWPGTSQYIKTIEHAQSRTLPALPVSSP